MKISIITLFPQVFTDIFGSSIVGRAQQKGLVQLEIVDLRSFGEGKHKTVDDRPYGGGVGMILRVDVLTRALAHIKTRNSKVILTSASGWPYKQADAKRLAKLNHLIIICGHYEGVDQRFIDKYVDLELSIGDFVLTGGEIPAMAIADSVVRLIPGVLEEEAITSESFENNLLEYPQYTRPEAFAGQKVPQVLLSGNHQQITKWRREEAQKKTKRIRPDLSS